MLQWFKKNGNDDRMDRMSSKTGKIWIAALCGIGVLFAAVGCASKEDRALYQRIHQRSPELRTLQQSEKIVFPGGEEDGTILLATYLPEEKSQGENFVIALYPEGSIPVGRFTLQGKAPTDLRKIRRSDLPPRLAGTIPSWFSVYRLRFPKVEGKRLILHVTGPGEESREIPFYKGPKYLVTKPKF